MKNFTFLFSFLLLFGCKENSEKKIVNKSKKENIIYTKELSNDKYIFNFSYVKDSLNPEITRFKEISIIERNRNLEIQIIKIDTIEMNERNMFFSIDTDINFDGYNDLCVLNYEGNYNNSYSYWLFNEKNNNFQHYKGLDNIYNPEVISEKKIICSKWHSGVSSFYLEKYFWNKDSLILKEKFEESWTDKGHLTVTKLIKGKYTVKDSIIKDNLVMFMKCR